MAATTHQITDLPKRRLRHHVTPVLVRVGFFFLVWLPVVVVEYRNLPNRSFVAGFVAPMELTLWLAAIAITVWTMHRAGHGRRLLAGWLLVLTLLGVHFSNWAPYHPESYYATHRYAFATVAAEVRAGNLGTSPTAEARYLPWYVRDLSTDGRVQVIGTRNGRPVVLLPQWLRRQEDSGGFVYVPNQPRGLHVVLFGERVEVSSGIDLGDGWFYLPGR